MEQTLPRARKEGLIVKDLPDEVLIYDLDREKAHCLNQTAAQIWQNCDGRRTVAQLRELAEKEAGAPVPEEIVWLALDQLEKFKLIDEAPAKPARLAGINRREMVRRVGIAAIALPIILSITAPTAQAQASGLPPGSCCNNPGQCSSGSCNQGGPCNVTPSSKSCA
jgi:Coenzyme PQQ synthesis protein D (PqqD)